MKVHLMFKDRDFDIQQKLPPNEQTLTQDLELNTLFNAMACGDEFLFEVAKKAVFSGFNNNLDVILYRQNILKDCLKNSSIVRNIYDIAVESLERRKKDYWGFWGKYPSGILHGSTRVLRIFVEMLGKLRSIADEHANKFDSEGFTILFTMLTKELNDEYFTILNEYLK